MKSKACKMLFLTVVLLISAVVASVEQTSLSTGQPQEYQVKAAFLFNFIRFVDWPNEKPNDTNEPIFIGVIGNDSFGDAFEPAKSKPVKGRRIIINRFKSFAELEKGVESQREIEIFKKCHLLFISASEKDKAREIIKLLEGLPVLTVGETAGLLESGGIIRLLTEDKKVCFEVNLGAAEKVNLRISSQLLRLAKRVIKDSSVSLDESKNKNTGTL
jgi:hypothetical protein